LLRSLGGPFFSKSARSKFFDQSFFPSSRAFTRSFHLLLNLLALAFWRLACSPLYYHPRTRRVFQCPFFSHPPPTFFLTRKWPSVVFSGPSTSLFSFLSFLPGGGDLTGGALIFFFCPILFTVLRPTFFPGRCLPWSFPIGFVKYPT